MDESSELNAFDIEQIDLGQVIRAGGHAEVRRGTDKGRTAGFLVTSTTGHARGVDAAQFEMSVPGVAEVAWAGALRRGRFADALVERIPARATPALAFGLFAPEQFERLGYELATVIEAVHETGMVVFGIRPELVYVDDERRLVVLAPYGPQFIATSHEKDLVYALPYAGAEVLDGRRPSQASDVFGFCATLVVLATGRHPFGPLDGVSMVRKNVTGDVRTPWSRVDVLGELVNRGLSRDPAARPAMAELVAAFRGILDGSSVAANADDGWPLAVPAEPRAFVDLAEAEAEAEAGDAEAQTVVAAAYLSGRDTPRDNAKGLGMLIAAAEQGYPPAQNDLAMLFGEGNVVLNDDARAFSWFKRAAEQGLVAAWINLASCYTHGRGTPVDLEQRVWWLTAAARAGHPEAQNELGVSYLRGLGVPQDAPTAVVWFLRSAEQGFARGQYNLASCFDLGIGVEADPNEAARWYAAAAARDRLDAT